MNNTPLRIGYLNCRGLSAGSFDNICSFIPSSFDIFFCTETWYQAPSYYSSHPLFLCASPLPPPRPTGGHHPGGLLCVISTHLRRHATFSTTSNSIDLSLFGSHIRALYLPPSLPSNSFLSCISASVPSSSPSSLPDIILGDINTRLGALANDNVSRPADRVVAIRQLFQLGAYSLVLPSPGSAKNHHVLVRQRQDFFWSYVDSAHLTRTDHKLMDCAFTPRTPVPVDDRREAFRISLKYLQHAAVRSLCCDFYESLATDFSQYCQDTLSAITAHAQHHQLDVFSLQERQSIVDQLDAAISTAILVSTEEACGSYSPSAMRATPDRYMAMIPDAASVSDAIRAFKRASRSRQVVLTSRDPTLTAAQDAVLHYTSVFQQTNPALMPPDESPYRGCTFESEVIFDTDFTAKALERFWSKYPTHVAGGLDGIHVRILRALSPSSMLSHVVSLFRICVLLGVTPASWNRSTIFPIPKKATSTINTFRPISLTLMMRRSFESLFMAYIRRSPCTKLHPTQAGFRRGFSTLTHTLIAHESAILGHKYRVFYDFAQAYDTVPVPLLLDKMRRRGASAQILALVDALFLRTSSVVVVNGQQTEPIELTRGLFQGSLLSPLLFDIFIDDLAQLLDEDTDRRSLLPRGLLFADDITAGTTTFADLQVSTDKVASWCVANGMVVNLAKCGVVGTSPTDPPLVFPNVGDIPVVSSYTYLGFPFERTGVNWGAHLENIATKASATLATCQNNGHLWSAGIRLAFYRTFVRSQMDYGAGIIYHWLMNSLDPPRLMPFPQVTSGDHSRFRLLLPLQKIQQTAITWITEHRGPYLAAHSMLALPVVTTRFSNLACMLTRHFQYMDETNPAVFLSRRLYSGPRTADRILPHCRRHPDIQRWRRADRQLAAGTLVPLPAGIAPGSQSYPLRLWLRNQFFDDCTATGQVLPRYFIADSRRNQTGAVHAVFLRSRRLRKNAIAWCLNHFAMGAKCTVCGDLFHRTHVSRCYSQKLLDVVPQNVFSSFVAFTAPDSFPENFNLVDYLLLFKRYSALALVFGYLEFWLRPRTNYDT